MKRIMLLAVGAPLSLFVLMQLVPYGRSHVNPPVVNEPKWDSPRTRELVVRACFDCHSNETNWTWYSHVAPASWLVQMDVDSGREELNFSEWSIRRSHESVSGEVSEGGMPQWYYTIAHPEADLTPAEKQELVDGLIRSGV